MAEKKLSDQEIQFIIDCLNTGSQQVVVEYALPNTQIEVVQNAITIALTPKKLNFTYKQQEESNMSKAHVRFA